MKKRTFIIVLTLCTIFLCICALSACGGGTSLKKGFSKKWSTDENYHWHASIKKNSDEKADYGEHQWDDGEIVVEATTESDGEISYTCTVCGKKKTVRIEKESEEEEENVPIIKRNVLVFKTLQFTFNTQENYYEASKNLSHDTESFNFEDEVTCLGNAIYSLSKEKAGGGILPLDTKNVSLNEQDSKFYLTSANQDDGDKTYCISLHINDLYVVNFLDAKNEVFESKNVEEGDTVSAPDTDPVNVGYQFDKWDFDFETVIKENTDIVPLFIANTNTPYKVIVQFQFMTKQDPDYGEPKTYDLYGTTGALVQIKPEDYIDSAFADGFFVDDEMSNAEGYISGKGDSVFNVYFARKVYNLVNKTPEYGEISCEDFPDNKIRYDAEVVIKVTYYKGCHFDAEKTKYLAKDLKSLEYSMYAKGDINFYFAKDDEYKDFESIHSKDKIKITDYSGKGGDIVLSDDVYEIGTYCFYNNDNITSLEIKHNFIKFGDFALAGMKALTSVKLPTNIQGGALTNGLFSGCTALKTLKLPSYIYSMESNSLQNCTSLESITFNSCLEKIGTGAFSTCDSLKELILPNSCRIIGQEFVGLKSVEKIVMPSTLNEDCFGQVFVRDCPKLKSIVFPKNMTNFGGDTIQECPNLEYIVLGDKITTCGYQNIRDVENNLKIYYEGTPEQYSNITKQVDYVDYVFGPCGCTIYYYSKDEKSGYYHYDSNNNPVLWL